MMKAAPPAPFIITEAEFLLELLIIALDPPSQLCQVDQAIEGNVLGQGESPAEPMVRRTLLWRKRIRTPRSLPQEGNSFDRPEAQLHA